MRPPSGSPWLTASGPGSSSMARIYSKTRLFRAPNSRHPKTGLFKRRLALDELMHLKTEAVVELARHPEPFRVSRPAGPSPTAAADWLEAGRAVGRRADERRAAYRDGGPKLTATTLRLHPGRGNGRRASPSTLPSRGEPGGIRLPARAWLTPCSAKPPSTRGSRRARRGVRSNPAWLTPGDNGKGVRHEPGTIPIDRRHPRRLAGRRVERQAADPLSGRHRRACPDRDRAGARYPHRRGAGGREDRSRHAMGARRPGEHPEPEGAGLQRRDEPERVARPPACPARRHRPDASSGTGGSRPSTPKRSSGGCKPSTTSPTGSPSPARRSTWITSPRRPTPSTPV